MKGTPPKWRHSQGFHIEPQGGRIETAGSKNKVYSESLPRSYRAATGNSTWSCKRSFRSDAVGRAPPCFSEPGCFSSLSPRAGTGDTVCRSSVRELRGRMACLEECGGSIACLLHTLLHSPHPSLSHFNMRPWSSRTGGGGGGSFCFFLLLPT